ncbi:hypothetical protein QZH41_014793 [Actinostola sp. cb2023]|nr:hypothetical protein QZH41_014793 [Actinostola sp. cb2023]
MSGSLLDEKENAKSANEFAKEDKAFTTSSILKPSQKENVLQLGQLTPQKAPKVTFKNTPVRHHPARYKAELLHHPLDTWEEIRSLDEVENWTERTQVVTREDHQLHIESTKEFLNNLIDNLPCFKYMKAENAPKTTNKFERKTDSSVCWFRARAKRHSMRLTSYYQQWLLSNERMRNLTSVVKYLICIDRSAKKEPGFSEISYKEKRENSSFENPVSLATTPIVNKPKTMDDGLDVDFAGPLDPAIASLNSLLKAGEDEERAFSPIGSGKASPDCDNMVTSDDIEKLLAPHNMPEEVDIPILELTHGSKIDAIMDSKFSGRHLDEVAAKLNELKLTSTKRNDTNADDSSDDDFALPVKPRGAPKKPPVIIEPKEDRKDSNEEKENGNDEDALPVRRRQPKAAPKKDVQSAPGEENETFKKPLPPKPWKTKKKKAPENDDPFLAMFAEPVC